MTAKEFKKTKKKSDLDKVVTLGLLLEYTDEFLIPRMAEMTDEIRQEMRAGFAVVSQEFTSVRQEIRASEYRLKTYVDRKITESFEELFKRLDERHRQDKMFKERLIEVLKAHKIGTKEDWAFFEGAVSTL